VSVGCSSHRSSFRSLSTGPCGRVERTNVRVAGDAAESFGEDAAAPLVGFALPDHAHPCSFEAKIESADAREEAPDIHRRSLTARYGVASRIPLPPELEP